VSRFIKNLVLLLVCLALVVPAVLLFCGVLPYRVYVVRTGSMIPTIPPKSAVIVEKGVYRVGHVISFESPNGVVTHRLVKRQAGGTLVTKGDANRTVDPGSLPPSQVIGGVVGAPRMLGYWLMYFRNPAGLASLFMTIVCVWLIHSLTMGYTQRAKRACLVAPARQTVEDIAGADGQGDSRVDVAEAAQADVAEAAQPLAEQVALAPGQVPLIFRCSRCGATFSSTQELWAHAADVEHDSRAREERQRLRAV